MRKYILLVLIGAMFLVPNMVSAQSSVRLAFVNVQLWPEYDQPSMLVIYDFAVAEGSSLPVNVTFRFPVNGNLIATAVGVNGGLQEIKLDAPLVKDEWQYITFPVTDTSTYRFEYYEPLQLNGEQRIFTYLWDSDYATDKFDISIREPLSAQELTTSPEMSRSVEDGVTLYKDKTRSLDAGDQFTLTLQYNKPNNDLVVQPQDVQINPIDDTTEGRPALSSYLPYLLGLVGVILIAWAGVYYYQSAQSSHTPRRRRSSHPTDNADEDIYCHQCGARAKDGDRFCRSCGTKLRLQEE